jgi:hypothetical protein
VKVKRGEGEGGMVWVISWRVVARKVCVVSWDRRD